MTCLPEDGPEPWRYVLRRSDLLDLFDTTPDLSGNAMDVSRFIRASEEKDAYLAWRDWEGESRTTPSLPDVADRELCPVPLGELRDFMKKHPVYVWNFATEEWGEADKGQTLRRNGRSDAFDRRRLYIRRRLVAGKQSQSASVAWDEDRKRRRFDASRRLSRVTGRPYPLTRGG